MLFLERFGGNGPVLHQVRHPLAVIGSLLKLGVLRDPPTGPWMRQYHRRLALSVITGTGDELTDCIRYWVAWNQRCEALADMTYRVEDMATRIGDIVHYLGGEPAREPAAVVEEIQKRRINTKEPYQPGDGITADTLPDTPDTEALFRLARRYGYDPAVPEQY